MAFDLSSITNEKRIRAPRIILLGTHKIGKSEFAAGSDSPIFLPIKGEEGLDDIDAWKALVCNSFNDVMGWVAKLYTDDHPYQTIVVDSGSTLEPLIHTDVCERLGESDNILKAGGGWGAGHTEATNTWRNLTEGLDALRSAKEMASIIIGHVKVKRFDDPNGESYDQYQWDIHDKAANLLYRWADSILFCNKKVLVKKEDVGFGKEKARGIELAPDTRFLYTQGRPAHPGGGRGVYGRLPYELPLNWGNFQDAVAQAMEQ